MAAAAEGARTGAPAECGETSNAAAAAAAASAEEKLQGTGNRKAALLGDEGGLAPEAAGLQEHWAALSGRVGCSPGVGACSCIAVGPMQCNVLRAAGGVQGAGGCCRAAVHLPSSIRRFGAASVLSQAIARDTDTLHCAPPDRLIGPGWWWWQTRCSTP